MSICKCRVGKAAHPLLEYQAAGAGHEEPDFSNMTGRNPRELAKEFGQLRSLRPGLGRAVLHGVIAHDPTARELSRDEWKKSIDIYLEAHGLQNCPYAAYLHFEKRHVHLHLSILRIDWAGNVVSDSNSYRKNMLAARRIEAELGLDAPRPAALEDRRPRGGGVSAERSRRRFERLKASLFTTDQPPQKGIRMIDPSLISLAVDDASDLDDLKKRLAEKGIEAEFTRAPGAAEPTGWCLRAGGARGTWIKGSDVDRGLSLKKVKERIEACRLERQRIQARELLGDLLDELDKEKDFQDTIELNEDQRLVRSQMSLLGALLQIPFEVMRRLIAAVANAIAAFLERLFGLPHSLGRIEIDQGGQPQAVAPAAPAPDSTAQQIAKLAAAQKIMAAALAQTVVAIRDGDSSLLPGSAVKDAQVQAARQALIEKVREIEGDQDEDDEQPQYERERPR